MKSPRFVPRIVFTTVIVGVVPACRTPGPGGGDVIVLAVQGFASGGAGGVSSVGGAGGAAAGAGGAESGGSAPVPVPTTATPPPPEHPQVIVLAVQGFRGKQKH